MKTQSEHSLAAKAIRAELKKEFPGIKFSVTSSSYAGGNSVRVDYVDGPQYAKVMNIVSKYQEGSFDGMNDIYNYDNRNADIPQVKYVLVQRASSEAVVKTLIEEVKNNYAGCENITFENYHNEYIPGFDNWASVIVHRLFSERAF